MSNELKTVPIVLDTFTADVTILSGRVQLWGVYFETNLNNDVLTLEDKYGHWVWRQTATAATVDNGSNYNQPTGQLIMLPKPILCDGLILDVSDGNYDGTCYALIYV